MQGDEAQADKVEHLISAPWAEARHHTTKGVWLPVVADARSHAGRTRWRTSELHAGRIWSRYNAERLRELEGHERALLAADIQHHGPGHYMIYTPYGAVEADTIHQHPRPLAEYREAATAVGGIPGDAEAGGAIDQDSQNSRGPRGVGPPQS